MMKPRPFHRIRALRRLFTARWWQYPQTWYFMPYSPKLYRAAVWLCGKITGHAENQGEWGYGGGGMIDTHCRWCDRVAQIPMAEAKKHFPELRKLEFTGVLGLVGQSGESK